MRQDWNLNQLNAMMGNGMEYSVNTLVEIYRLVVSIVKYINQLVMQ